LILAVFEIASNDENSRIKRVKQCTIGIAQKLLNSKAAM